LKKSSLQNLIPSILENLTHQNFILKLPDLYQAKIKPKICSLILTVKASNFEYCLFPGTILEPIYRFCFSKAVILFCATKEPGCAIKGA
jgi:hypothetical protein